jgi:hypothetical protein
MAVAAKATACLSVGLKERRCQLPAAQHASHWQFNLTPTTTTTPLYSYTDTNNTALI